MSKETLGQKIGNLRREKSLTQEELAEKLGVSPQAVSKWENDVSCPDIMLLPEIAKLFDVTTDLLLGCEQKPEVQIVPQEERRKLDEMVLHIIVNSSDGDKVRINIPMSLVKMGIEVGMDVSQITGTGATSNIDLNRILSLVENGMIGKLIEVESSDGDIVEIVVEEI